MKLNKDNLHDLLLTFYKETKEEARSVGLRKGNLIGNSLIGLTLLFYFILYIIGFEVWTNPVILVILIIFGICMFGIFVLYVLYFIHLNRVESTHHLTGLKIEDIIFDIIYHDKEKEEVEKEIKDLFPHIRCVDKLGIYRKKWFKKNAKNQKEEKLLDRFENKYYKH